MCAPHITLSELALVELDLKLLVARHAREAPVAALHELAAWPRSHAAQSTRWLHGRYSTPRGCSQQIKQSPCSSAASLRISALRAASLAASASLSATAAFCSSSCRTYM